MTGAAREQRQDDLAALDLQAKAAAAALAPAAPEADAPQPDAPAAPQPSTADMLTPLIGAAFGLLAPAWAVQENEARTLAEVWAPVLDKYFPGGLALGVEANALLVTLAVIGPRWNTPRKIEKPADAPADVPQS